MHASNNPAAVLALLQNVGIPIHQLRNHPGFEEVDATLIAVWFSQNREPRLVLRYLFPDAVVVLGQLQAHLSDVGRDSGDAGIDRGEGQQSLSWSQRYILLPSARVGFHHVAEYGIPP